MRLKFITSIIFLTIINLSAQEIEWWNAEKTTETQEILIPSQKVYEITPEFESKILLFPWIPGKFVSANVFKTSDSYLLEILYRKENILMRERLKFSERDFDSFKNDLNSRLTIRAPYAGLNQEGRGWFILGSTLLSLGFYGLAIPIALDINEPGTALGLYMFISAGAFYSSYQFTKKIPVNYSHLYMSYYGAVMGIYQGFLVEQFLLGKEKIEYYQWDPKLSDDENNKRQEEFDRKNNPQEKEENERRKQMAFATLTSLGTGFLGYKSVDWLNIDTGKAHLIGILGTTGTFYGKGFAFLADFTETDDGKIRQPRLESATIMLSTALGIYSANWLANKVHYTMGDAFLLQTSSDVGLTLSFAILDLLKGKKERPKVLTSGLMLGSFAGLVLGDRLFLKNEDFTLTEGLIITGGNIAGNLLGLGVVYLTDPKIKLDSKYYSTASALGGALAFYITYKAFSGKDIAKSENQSINASFHPENLTALALNKFKPNLFFKDINSTLPILSVRF